MRWEALRIKKGYAWQGTAQERGAPRVCGESSVCADIREKLYRRKRGVCRGWRYVGAGKSRGVEAEQNDPYSEKYWKNAKNI